MVDKWNEDCLNYLKKFQEFSIFNANCRIQWWKESKKVFKSFLKEWSLDFDFNRN